MAIEKLRQMLDDCDCLPLSNVYLRSRLKASGSVGDAGVKVTVHVVSTMSDTQVKVPGRERMTKKQGRMNPNEHKRIRKVSETGKAQFNNQMLPCTSIDACESIWLPPRPLPFLPVMPMAAPGREQISGHSGTLSIE